MAMGLIVISDIDCKSSLSFAAEIQQFLAVRHIRQPDCGPTDAATELPDRPLSPPPRPPTQAEKQSTTAAASELVGLARGVQVGLT